MNNFLFRLVLPICLLSVSVSYAQNASKYDLSAMLTSQKLVTYPNQKITQLNDDGYKGISVAGITWLKGINFSTGTIDVDIRGRDVFQQSFVGISFHGVDTVRYEAVYFRPFNFQSADILRLKHMVQYISEPEYPWDRLRNERPLVYESGIASAPKAAGWFHARIVVTMDEVIVYTGHSAKPSLRVKRLSNRNEGMIGLWSSALPGDFANLVISPAVK